MTFNQLTGNEVITTDNSKNIAYWYWHFNNGFSFGAFRPTVYFSTGSLLWWSLEIEKIAVWLW